METQDCPLPEVASSLSPFIKSRDEVSAIRRNLQAYLQKQLPLDDTPLSAINLTTPLEKDLKDPPSGLTGVRKAYWKALQANQTAQAKYDALKSDLEALKHHPPSSSDSQTTPSINESHIPLLRQKEKLRRLKVLERAYGSLPTLPTSPLEDQLKAQLGEQPVPPSTHPPSTSTKVSSSPDVEARLLDLKKAVLATQRRVQDQESRNAVARASLPDPMDLSPGAQIAGLQSALQVLTGWMEEQLAIIADAEAEAAEASVPPTPGGGRTPGNAPFAAEEVERAYERYLSARKRLVHAIHFPPHQDSDGVQEERDPLFPPASSKSHVSGPTPVSPPTLLLPHIPALAHNKAASAALLQQKAHLRALLASSEGQTRQLMARLAGESHLVSPGAGGSGKDWAEASKEVGGETEKAVLARVEKGKGFAQEAGESVVGLEKLAGA